MLSGNLIVQDFSLNGDYGTFYDGAEVVCTIDKSITYKVVFSVMAQISKSDFGIFYGVTPVQNNPVENNRFSGTSDRFPLYVLPAVYVALKTL